MFLKSLMLAAVLYLAAGSHIIAQSKINGRVIDLAGKELPNATVLLLSGKDSSLIKGTMSDRHGLFSFQDVNSGQLLVSSSFAGHHEAYSLPFYSDGKTSMTPLVLTLSRVERLLGAVTVTAKKPLYEQAIDRLIINVAASITNSAGTALDVLMRSPGIFVNHQDNSISLNGKDGVVVMINGKINRIPMSAVFQLLAGMNASNIEKIELISTPPANFDAEGNGGYINIVLKTNTAYGTNGGYSVNLGYGLRLKGATSINFNHRKGKLNVYGDYSLSRMHDVFPWEHYRKVSFAGETRENSTFINRDLVIRNHNARLGLDYEISKRTTLGFLVSTINNLYATHETSSTNRVFNFKVDTTIRSRNREKRPLLNSMANINFVHLIKADEKISVNLDYITVNEEDKVDYLMNYYDARPALNRHEKVGSNKVTPLHVLVGSADYTKTVNKKVNFEAGMKLTVSNFKNNVSVERSQNQRVVIDPKLSSTFLLDERIGAAYSAVAVKFNKKTNGKIGLRYEYTQSDLDSATSKAILNRRYGKWFPSVFLSHSINDEKSLNFSYTSRMTRPTFKNLAPWVYLMDPYTFFSGNVSLLPSISHSIKTDYAYKRSILSLSYTHELNHITNFASKVDSATNEQILAAENQKSKNTFALNFTLPITVTRRWTIQNNISGYWMEMNAVYKSNPLHIVRKLFVVNSTHTISLPKDYTFEASGWYQSGGFFTMYNMGARYSMNLGIQKKFGPSGSSLRFAVTDVFGPPHFKYSIDAPQYNLVTRGDYYVVNTTFNLTYSARFGNDKVKERRTRTTGSEEERRRLQAD